MDPQKLYIRQVTKALESLGQEILNIMKAQAPVKTGKLKRSIRYKVVTKNGNPALSFYYIYYGVYVDLGTYSNADKASYGMSQFICLDGIRSQGIPAKVYCQDIGHR
jgi:hypothetical protein